MASKLDESLPTLLYGGAKRRGILKVVYFPIMIPSPHHRVTVELILWISQMEGGESLTF